MLSYWLLTADQLDDIAHFYHQRVRGAWSADYPNPISWASDLTLEEKRYRIGQFIGLRIDPPLRAVGAHLP